MTKVLATGVATNIQYTDHTTQNGKPFKKVNLEVGGKSFTGIFSRPQNLTEGMYVRIVETPPVPPQKYTQRSIEAVDVPSGAAPAAVGAVPSQPVRSGYQKDPAEQDRIMRQWAVTQAINFVNLARETGALTKTALSNETTLYQIVGKYANLWFNAVQTGAAFEKMPQFTGEVNEVSSGDSADA